MTSSVIAIVGGRLLPMHGAPIEAGTVVVRDGRIAAVGSSADVALPADAEVVRAEGCWVLPGLIDAHTHVGIEEQSVGEPGDDLNEASRPDDAELRVIDGINPADQAFEDALAAGVTTVAVLPGSASPIGGQTALVKCRGRTVDEMVVRSPAGVKSALGENPKRVWATRHAGAATRPGIAALIRRAFTAAQQAASDAPQESSGTPAATLRRVLDGELPWHQHAHRADDIATALRLADEFGYRLVIHHGTEAHLLADILAARDIPVVCGPLIGTRAKVELAGRTWRTPAVLHAAGVRVAITTDHPGVPIQLLVLQAALAVKAGMDRDAALRAITSVPAEIYGVADRIGSLTVGADADVVLWSGDPLDLMSRPLQVYVDGSVAYRDSAW